MTWSVVLSPLLPLPLIAAAGLVALVLCAILLWRRQRGTFLRALAFTLLIVALLNPSLTETERDRLPGIAAVIVDESASQVQAKRQEIVAAVREALADRLSRFKDIEIRWASVRAEGSGEDGTALFSTLNRLLSDVPPERIAGAVLVTDGQVHDVPANAAALGFDAPVHALITARPGEHDRRLIVHRAPRFGLVGKSQVITLRVEDLPREAASQNVRDRVQVTVRRDGETVSVKQIAPGENALIPVDITHGGMNIFEFEAEPLAGELTIANNRAVVATEGIRENLRVLLVSGEPHAGERTWRNLLKSDASVDLVHFTILRPPEKQDGTPINQLSLIAFPTRELFSVKIDEFDLIVLDRYQRRGVLPIIYFDNIARYVREGGALLVAAGPDFAGTPSIYRSPLAPVLPAEPTGRVIEEPFRATVAERGRRHPVTRGLPGADADPPRWGRWFRAVEATPDRGETVMNGPDNVPLLILSREEEGRVALLLTDHAWLWSRGFEGGGPQIALLRRLSHWLMKEPELEEERLSAHGAAGKLVIERQTMGEEAAPVKITTPSGAEREVALERSEPGLWRAEIEAGEIGLYHLTDGKHTALANVGPLNPKELAELIATEDKVADLVADTGGGTVRIDAADAAGELPRITLLSDVRHWAGRDWIALKRTDAYVVRGIRSIPLFAGLLGLALLLAGLAATWYREGR
ncbi:MAG: hypothetical protein Q8P46_14130 [Hyphomicrobiales bacterium]|nr:hypothetical protein [Hyphomicrobiales bacterium]